MWKRSLGSMGMGFLICAALGLSSSARAQPVEFERILLPILLKPFPGGFGTQWRVDAQMLIDTEENPQMFPLVDCVLCIERLPRRTSFPPPLFFQQANHPPGTVLWIDKPHADLVRLSLRLRELTRGAAAGIELPVVREREFFTATIHILDIPLRNGARTTLRVYDVDSRAGAAARIRFFEPAAVAPLLTLDAGFVLSPAHNPNFTQNVVPGFIQLSGLEELYPELSNVDRIRMDIEPLTPGLTIWAFVSITDDTTQQVTLLTPQ